jgi:stage III sporulation protein AE
MSNIDFKQELYNLLSGNADYNITDIFTFLFDMITSKVASLLPSIVILFVIGVIGSLITSVSQNNETNNLISVIVTISAILITIVSFREVVTITYDIVTTISDFVSIIFPIMLSLVVTTAGVSTHMALVSITTVVSSVIHFVFQNILYPIIILIYVLTICSSISSFIKLDKISSFMSSLFKFAIGVVFTIFFGYLGLQSLTIMRFDTISIKATKFAIASYVPLIGGFLSQGFDYVMMGSVLIKNAIGIIGIIFIAAFVFVQVINIYLLRLGYSFIGGVLEIVGDSAVSKYLDKYSKLMLLPIVLILAVSFFYIVLLVVFVSTANIGVV